MKDIYGVFLLTFKLVDTDIIRPIAVGPLVLNFVACKIKSVLRRPIRHSKAGQLDKVANFSSLFYIAYYTVFEEMCRLSKNFLKRI